MSLLALPIFRFPVVFTIGFVCWALALRLLQQKRINVGKSYGIGDIAFGAKDSLKCALLAICMATFFTTPFIFETTKELIKDLYPFFFYALLVLLWTCPWDLMWHSTRILMLKVFKNIFIIPNDTGPQPFEELIADIFTSISKCFGDIELSIILMLNHIFPVEVTNNPENMLYSFIVSIPFILRARQCMSKFKRDGQTIHMINFWKYMSVFPVLFGKHWEANFCKPGSLICARSNLIFHGINSMYSFFFDIIVDWKLLEVGKWKLKLRSRRLLGHVGWYILAICADFCLRILWSIQINQRFHLHLSHNSLVLLYELCEIGRRVMWIVFKTEWMWISYCNKNNDKIGTPIINHNIKNSTIINNDIAESVHLLPTTTTVSNSNSTKFLTSIPINTVKQQQQQLINGNLSDQNSKMNKGSTNVSVSSGIDEEDTDRVEHIFTNV